MKVQEENYNLYLILLMAIAIMALSIFGADTSIK